MQTKLLLGHSMSGKSIPWNGGDNPHISIFGRSGTGKSFFIKRMLEQAVQQGILGIVFDYTGDFLSYTPTKDLAYTRINVLSPEFTINPLIDVSLRGPDVPAQQLSSLVKSIFPIRTRTMLALQKAAHEYLSHISGIPSINGLIAYATEQMEMSKGLSAALEPLELFSTLIHCGDTPISIPLTAPGLIILDFDGIVNFSLRQFLVELILQTIWNQKTAVGVETCPLVLVLDECQNLLWNEHSMAARILREGRKFELAGWFSSQWIDNKNKDACAALGQAALQINFRPDDQNMERLAKRLCPSKSQQYPQYQKLLRSLRVGQFLLPTPRGPMIVKVESGKTIPSGKVPENNYILFP